MSFRTKIRRLAAAAGVAIGLGGLAGTVSSTDGAAEAAATYCSVPAIFAGPDSDTWSLPDGSGGWVYLYVGDVCANHDSCYSGSWNFTRSQCDTWFRDVLLMRCYATFTGTPEFECARTAFQWYWAVDTFGGSHFNG